MALDFSSLSDALGLEVDPGVFADWLAGVDDQANVQASEARDLCSALRIDDGANIDKILSTQAVTLPATAETASATPADVSSGSEDSTPSSSPGSPTELAPVDPAPAPDPATPAA